MFESLCPLWPHRYHAHITGAELSDRAIPISLWMLIENKKHESWEGISNIRYLFFKAEPHFKSWHVLGYWAGVVYYEHSSISVQNTATTMKQ